MRLGEGRKIREAPALKHRTRLLIFDLNHVLCNIEFVSLKKKDIPADTYVSTEAEMQYELPALIKALGKESFRLVTARPNVRQFLRSLLAVAHVGVWTCMGQDMATPIVSWLFGECKPSFLLSQRHCTTLKHEVENKMYRSEQGSHDEFFKELALFRRLEWGIDLGGFVPSEENTVIIDDSPLKCFFNPRGNCIFPYPWRSILDENSDLMKDIKIFQSLCLSDFPVYRFIEDLLEDGDGFRVSAQNPISKDSRIAKSLEPYTRRIRPNKAFLERIDRKRL